MKITKDTSIVEILEMLIEESDLIEVVSCLDLIAKKSKQKVELCDIESKRNSAVGEERKKNIQANTSVK